MYKTFTNEFSFRLKPSLIEGIGVFAIHGIAKGTKLMLKPENYRSRRMKEKDIPKELLRYCVKDEDEIHRRCPNQFNHMWLCWFLNHSNKPNAKGDENNNFTYYALRNIKAGEEITIDYGTLEEPGSTKYKKIR